MINAIMEYYDVCKCEAEYMVHELDEFEKDHILTWYMDKHGIEY